MDFISGCSVVGNVSACVTSTGLIKLTVTAHGLATNDRVHVLNVLGTTEANGSWTVTVVNANEFTLNSSTFANTYVSGGTVYLQQELMIKAATSPSAAVDACISYREVVEGHVYDAKTRWVKLTNTTAVVLKAAVPGMAFAIESICILNNASSTILFTTYIQEHNSTTRQHARLQLETNQRGVVAKALSTIVTATGGQYFQSPPP